MSINDRRSIIYEVKWHLAPVEESDVGGVDEDPVPLDGNRVGGPAAFQ